MSADSATQPSTQPVETNGFKKPKKLTSEQHKKYVNLSLEWKGLKNEIKEHKAAWKEEVDTCVALLDKLPGSSFRKSASEKLEPFKTKPLNRSEWFEYGQKKMEAERAVVKQARSFLKKDAYAQADQIDKKRDRKKEIARKLYNQSKKVEASVEEIPSKKREREEPAEPPQPPKKAKEEIPTTPSPTQKQVTK